MENKNWQKLDRMADMRKAPDADGNMELFTNVSGMECHDPTRAASQQYKALHLVCRYLVLNRI